jgi:glycosyltransferase involved in cell wall biosynthesis
VDAVTSQALSYRELFDRWGWTGEDRAHALDPRMDGRVRLLAGFKPAPDDVLLIHYSAYAPALRRLLALPNPKLLVSHNVTPARYMWRYAAVVAIQCELGEAMLGEFARAVDLAAGVSAFNVADLKRAGAERTAVIPILFDRARLPEAPVREPRPGDAPTVLFVGRLAPHKRQDRLIRAFALYRAQHAPAARLVLVGEALSPAYREALLGLAESVAPGAVTIESGLEPAELWRRYAQADVFCCLSEHEGFCVPLLEAFHFGLPVVARPAGGVPEVAGDAALLTDDEDLAVIAELLNLAATDADLRAELRQRGELRLEEFAFDATAAKLRAAVESVVG